MLAASVIQPNGMEMVRGMYGKLEPPQYYNSCSQGTLVDATGTINAFGSIGHLSNGNEGVDPSVLSPPFRKRVKRTTMSSMSSNDDDLECLEDGPSSSGYFVTTARSPPAMVSDQAMVSSWTNAKLARRDCKFT